MIRIEAKGHRSRPINRLVKIKRAKKYRAGVLLAGLVGTVNLGKILVG
jgi:hypothetical protein